jgi:predicted nicotinamide N-methyase
MPDEAASDPDAALRYRLLHRIRRNYETVSRLIDIGPFWFDFTSVANPDLVLDQVAAKVDLEERLHGPLAADQPMHLPYWAELWDSAAGIGLHLIRHKELAIGNVLDLGCGMGLAGTVAAAMGARVTFADLEQPALLFARLNSLPWRKRVRTRQLDWRRNHLGEKFDLIIGSDILYEKSQWEFLEPFWRGHLAPGGSVLLGEPGRATGGMFIDWIKPRGWMIEINEQPVTTRPTPIRLLKIKIA